MNSSQSHNHLYFEKLGDNFDSFMSDYDVARRGEMITSLLGEQINESESIEIGCGNGAITKYLVPRLSNLRVVDISGQLAQKTGEKFNLPWTASDACNLGIKDQTYSTVISSECIEHTPDPVLALKEMCRILKPGGTLIVTSPNRLWYPILLIANFLGLRKFQGPENWLWPTRAAQVIKDQGFKIQTITGCHLFPWQIPGAKKILPFLDKVGPVLYPLYINFCIKAIKLG